jgi:hypothetical protein
MRCDLREIAELRGIVSRESPMTRAELEDVRRRLLRFRQRARCWPDNERLLHYLDLSIMETDELISQAVSVNVLR